MGELELLQSYLVVGAMLFSIGLVGFLTRRNMIVMFLAVEMMLQGVSVSLVAWSRFHNDWGGQILVIFILTVAACEAAIALVLVLMLFHASGRLDIAAWQNLRESSQQAFVDEQLPEAEVEEQHWPVLTPSGIEPTAPTDEMVHRSHV
ncbi:MAG TPA: NADH-quinone oxidoreductase subunit NuoK [Pirellulales bacterium]|jgi:NADH-quinone oxidoreductase subunit K